MAIPLDLLEISRETVPKDILCVLKKYPDVMPNNSSKSLPPQRMIDYEIELLLGTKLHAKNAYHMTPLKLVGLWKQLNELLSAGLLGLQKHCMRPQSFSRRRRMRVYSCVSTIVP